MTTASDTGCQLSGLLKKLYGEFVYGNSAVPSNVHNLLRPLSAITPPQNGVEGATPASNSSGIMNLLSKSEKVLEGIFASPTSNSAVVPGVKK